MGRKKHYVPGSFYQVDDRTGFPERVERTRRQWDNLVVKEARWEPRQPQDFVRGVRDDQSVDTPRPITDPTFILPVWSTVMEDVPIGGTEIPLESIHTFGIGSHVAAMLASDMGDMFHTFVTFVGFLPTSGLIGVIIRDPLPRVVPAGQQFWNFSLGGALPPDPPCWIIGGTPLVPSADEVIAGSATAPSSSEYAIAGTPADPACDEVGTHIHARSRRAVHA